MNAIQDIAKATGAGVAAPSANSNSSIEDRFLKLLVTQMKNQDPLNPLDNAQVTSQLAQINTVNGIEKLNTTLSDMAASFRAGQSLQSAALIGRTALADGNQFMLAAGGPARGGVHLDRAADSIKVTINDASGKVVRQLELGPKNSGLATFDWDGRNDAGATLTPGAYSFQVAALGGGQKVASTPLTFGAISGVSPDNTGAKVTVDGLGQLTLQQIRNIR